MKNKLNKQVLSALLLLSAAGSAFAMDSEKKMPMIDQQLLQELILQRMQELPIEQNLVEAPNRSKLFSLKNTPTAKKRRELLKETDCIASENGHNNVLKKFKFDRLGELSSFTSFDYNKAKSFNIELNDQELPTTTIKLFLKKNLGSFTKQYVTCKKQWERALFLLQENNNPHNLGKKLVEEKLIDVISPAGQPLLCFAVVNKIHTLTALLLSQRAKIENATAHSKTILHLLADPAYFNKQIFEYVLIAASQYNKAQQRNFFLAEDASGQTALDVAFDNNSSGMYYDFTKTILYNLGLLQVDGDDDLPPDLID